MTGKEFHSRDTIGASVRGVLGAVGFKAVLCWHYIVLFSPILVARTYTVEMQTLFTRQFPMYASMALAFGLLMLLGKKFVGADRPSRRSLLLVGVLGAVATIVSVAVHTCSRPVRIASVLFLGPTEALAMFLWLRFYVQAAEDRLFKQFAIDMIFGGVGAFLICNFTDPLSYLLTASLPLAAMVSLDEGWEHAKAGGETSAEYDAFQGARSGMEEPFWKKISFSVRMALPRMMFAFVFGMVQGGFLFVNIPLMVVSDSLVIGFGVVVAGAIILAMSDRGGYSVISDRMHRMALLLFGLGIVGLIIIRNIDLGYVALLLFEMLILAGFNLVDFGGLVTSCVMRERLGFDATTYLDSGRVLAYAGLAAGLLCGYVVLITVDVPVDHLLVVLCCAGLVILMIAVLLPGQVVPAEPAARCALAEEGACSAVSAELVALNLQSALDTASRDSSVENSSEEEDAERSAGESPSAGDLGSAPASWSEVCDHVSDLYNLSRREKDVFYLVAKGRNAEYIQNELFISIHTVKTHMSHIYRKLGVHSSQELISLIEEYQVELNR